MAYTDIMTGHTYGLLVVGSHFVAHKNCFDSIKTTRYVIIDKSLMAFVVNACLFSPFRFSFSVVESCNR